MMEFLDKIEEGASLEIFDIHNADKLIAKEKEKEQEKDLFERISPDSLFISYFSHHLLSIMNISEEKTFSKTYGFRPTYINTMMSESLAFNNQMENFKASQISKLKKNKAILANIFQFLRWLSSYLFMQVVLHFEVIIKLIINVYSMVNFLFYVSLPKFHPLLVYTLLMWNILSMVSQSAKVMMWATLLLIYPFYFIDFVQVVAFKLSQSIPKNEVMAPFSSLNYFFIVFLTSIHLVMAILAQVTDKESSFYFKFIAGMDKKNEVSSGKFLSICLKIVDLIKIRFNRIYRYIPIILAIITALYSITIVNLILLIFALVFMWNSNLDVKHWRYFCGYVIFVIVLKQIGNYTISLQEYNIEFLAILGFVSIEQDNLLLQGNRSLMVFNYILTFFCCGWYKHINKKFTPKNLNQVEEEERKMKSLSDMEVAKYFWMVYNFIGMIFKYYSIWIYHICANLLLLTDTRDILSMTIIVSEYIISFIHIIIWNRQGTHPYEKIYKVWRPSFYLVVFYSLCRYIFFFLKYTTIKYLYRSFTTESTQSDMDRFFLTSVNSIGEAEMHNVSSFIGAFIRPLLLLTLAVLTRETLQTYIREIKQKEQAESTDDTSGRNTLKGQRASIMRISQMRNTTLMRSLITNFEDRNYTVELGSINRQTNPFLVIYLVFKGVFLGVVMKYFHVNMNILKFFMIVCALFNMQKLFVSMIDLCNRMHLLNLFTLKAKYFYLTFLTGHKWKTSSSEEIRLAEIYTDDMQKKDLAQNKIYYEQFLLRMESILFWVNRTFWGLTFFPLLILSALVVLINYFMRDPKIIAKYYLEILIGISPEKWLNEKEVTKELMNIQIVITGLFLEYMLTSYYLDCKKVLSEITDDQLDGLLKNLLIKYEFFVDLRKEQIPKEDFENRLTGFQTAITTMPSISEQEQKSKVGLSRKPTLVLNAPVSKRAGSITVVPEEAKAYEDAEKEKQDEEEEDEAEEELKDKVETNSVESDKGKYSEEEEESSEEDTKKMKKDDENELQDIFEGIRSALLEGKGLTTSNFMTEKITKEEMLLYMYRNKYKYYAIKCLEGFFFALTRIAILPLLTPAATQVNALTIGFYVIFYFQSIVDRRSFIRDTQQKNWIVLLFLILQTLHNFVHERLMAQSNSKYQQFFTGKAMLQFRYLLQPIAGDGYSTCYYWLFINSLGFAFIPIFVWISTKALFREKFKKSDAFHFYLFDKHRKRNVVINYSKWKSSSLSFINLAYKTAYINSLEIHSVIIMVSLMFFWKNVFIILFLYTLGLTAYENFKGDASESTKSMRIAYTKKVIRMFINIYWGIICFYHFIQLMAKFGFFPDYDNNNPNAFMSKYDGGYILIFLLGLSGVTEDLFLSEDFDTNFMKLKTESELKIRYANISKAYDMNEFKIYSRVIEMMRKRMLDDVGFQLMDRKDISKISIPTHYMEKSIVDIINGCSTKLRERYLPFMKRTWISLLNTLYDFLMKNTNHYRNQDMLFVYQNVKMKNKWVVQEQEINLEDYFDENFNSFQGFFTDLTRFYGNLKEGTMTEITTYDERVNNFLKIDFSDNMQEFVDNPDLKNQLLIDPLTNSAIANRRAKMSSRKFTSEAYQLDSGYENKSPAVLKSIVNLLGSIITTKYDQESRTQLENYKLEFTKCGSMHCLFGRLKVVLYNIKNDDVSTTMGYNQWKTGVIFKYLTRAFSSNAEYLISFVVIVLQILHGGLFNTVLIGIVVFTTFIEETTGRSFWWRILYCLYLFVICFKQMFNASAYLSANPLIVVFFFGELSIQSDVICTLLVIYLIGILRKYSVDNKSAIDFENPGLAMARLTLNNDLQNMIDRYCNEETRKKEFLNLLVSARIKNSYETAYIKEFQFCLMKQVVEIQSKINSFKKEFMRTSQKLIRAIRHDFLKVKGSDFESFFFRNFSHFLRKPGASYNGIASVVLIIMIAYVLLFFPTLSSEKNGIASFVSQNKVTAFTVINFGIYLTFFVLHFYLDQMKSNDIKGMNSKDYSMTLLANFDAMHKKNMKPTMLEMFRTIATIVKNIMNMIRNIKDSDGLNSHRENPLFYLFLFSLGLWTYLNFSVFFWHTSHGNSKSPTKSGIFKFICEAKDKEGDFTDMNTKLCLNYSENIHSIIFYALNVIYLIICMLQIRDGKILHKSKITDFNNIWTFILYKLYAAMPLVRETRITFEYCATKTSLWFTDFTLVKELEYLLQDSKIQHETNMESRTGKMLPRIFQNIVCYVIILVVITMFAVPLALFYNTSNRSYYDITSAAISIDLYAGKSQKITNLFYSSKLKTNQQLNTIVGGDAVLNNLMQDYKLKRYDRNHIVVSLLSDISRLSSISTLTTIQL